jgi:hypothetical protein
MDPREIEEQTQKAVVRDYGAAWASLASALDQNRPGALGDMWAGFAREQALEAIAGQKRSGLRVRFRDDSHHLQGLFYSPEGSALQLRDSAHYERHVLDGVDVLTSETLHVQYLVVMTPAADHWQVRILQAVTEPAETH